MVTAERLGASSRWPALWNANRLLYGTSTEPTAATRAGVGRCIYIPSEWFRAVSNRSKYGGSDASQCSGRTKPRGQYGGLVSKVTTAQQTLGIGDPALMLSFTRSRLYSVTQTSIGGTARPKRPTLDQWNAINRRVASANTEARRWISAGTSPAAIIGSTVRFVDDSHRECRTSRAGTVCVNAYDKPAYCTGDYCTVGRFIFGGRGDRPSQWELSHEYIHVLQYEGLGWDKFRERYLQSPFALLDSPSVRLEAAGYLWEGWSYMLANVEKEPWQVWIQGWEAR